MITKNNRNFLLTYGPMSKQEMDYHLSRSSQEPDFQSVIRRHDVHPDSLEKMYHPRDTGYHLPLVENPKTPHHILQKLMDIHGFYPTGGKHPEFVQNNVENYINNAPSWHQMNGLFSNRINLSRDHIDKLKHRILKSDEHIENRLDLAISLSYHKDSTKDDVKELFDHAVIHDNDIEHWRTKQIGMAAKYKGFDLSK